MNTEGSVSPFVVTHIRVGRIAFSLQSGVLQASSDLKIMGLSFGAMEDKQISLILEQYFFFFPILASCSVQIMHLFSIVAKMVRLQICLCSAMNLRDKCMVTP